MRPYYEAGGVTLYHADAREVVAELPATVCLTDPPWEMKVPFMQGSLEAVELWRGVAPQLRVERLLVWLPVQHDPRRWLTPVGLPYLRLVYIRRAIPSYYGRVLMDGEVVHCLGTWPAARAGRMVIPGGLAITYVQADRIPGHPGNRSLRAARWLLSWWSDPGDTILDPFAGSGTTLVAAKDMGRRAVGVEIEERYCEIAARALAQEVLPLEPAAGGPEL